MYALTEYTTALSLCICTQCTEADLPFTEVPVTTDWLGVV